MDRLAKDYVNAAVVAKRASCDAIELYCDHGYLLSQFLCPLTNTRNDNYVGSRIQNRLRFPLRVMKDFEVLLASTFPYLSR